jgi:hypothetical protein
MALFFVPRAMHDPVKPDAITSWAAGEIKKSVLLY